MQSMTPRPLVSVALGFAGGLLLGEWFQPPLPWLFGTTFLILLLALHFASWRATLLWPCVILCGWTIHNAQLLAISPCDLRNIGAFSSGEAKLVTLRGSLVYTPMLRATEREGLTLPRTRAQVAVSFVRLPHGEWMQASGDVLVSGPGPLPSSYYAGREVELTGVLAFPPEAQAPGLLNYRAYLRRHGIHFLLRTMSTADWRLADQGPGKPPLTDRFQRWGYQVLGLGLPPTHDSLDLLRGMTLGSMAGLTAEDFDPFIRSGTMHIFAISGLHIVLISGMLWQLLRVLQFSRFYCGLLSLPTIWFYTAATGWQPSAIRATIMMSVLIGGLMLARPADMLNSVAAAALIILAFDPQQMFGASFQLSFFVVLSLGLLMPGFQARIDKWLAYDPLLPPELATKSQRWQRWIARQLLLAIAVSVAAWLGAVPLTAYYFNLVGPVTLLANVLVVPTSNLALAANLGALFCGGWSGTLTELFNNCAWGLMNFIVWLSRHATGIHGGHWFVANPSVLDCCLYYGILISIGSGVFSNERFRRWAWAGTGLCIALVTGGWLVRDSGTELTVLPVQSGASLFVRDRVPPKTLLIDSGTSNSVHYLTKSFLRSQGCNRLDALMLTHGDLQHVEGTGMIEETMALKGLYVSPVRFRSAIYRKIVERHEKQNLSHLARGDHLGNWHVLHPGADDRASKADDAPLVLWGTFAPTAPTILLLPDLSSMGQKALLEAYPSLQADVVIVSPPGEDEFLGTELLSTLRPTLIILQDASYPHYERPSAALRDRLSRAAHEVLYASEEGAITLRLKHNIWEVRTMRGFKRRVGKAGQNPVAVTGR